MAASSAMPSTPRLPEGWSSPETVEDSIVADGLELRRAGLSALGPTGEEITGAAVEVGSSPRPRATFELLERVATLDAIQQVEARFPVRLRDGTSTTQHRTASELFPSSDAPTMWRPARSNGIALHTDWATAALRAEQELVERDRILRSWYGELCPKLLPVDWNAMPVAPMASYDWNAVELHHPAPTFGHDLQVVGVFGFPRASEAPLAFGFAARGDRAAALDAALREAMQILAFLWGEPVAVETPASSPTPSYHLDYWQRRASHQDLRRWLGGAHTEYWVGAKAATTPRSDDPEVRLVDLTPPWLREQGLCLAKAESSHATPLAFGAIPFAAHLPERLRVHPIA